MIHREDFSYIFYNNYNKHCERKKTMTLNKENIFQSGIFFICGAGWIVAALSGRAVRQQMVSDSMIYSLHKGCKM